MKEIEPPTRLLATQRSLTAFLRDPDAVEPPAGVEARRLAIYQRLFFNNLSNLFRRNFPVVRKLYEQADWDALIRDFMVHQRPSTPMFTEIGSEFVKFLEDRQARGRQDPPWLVELAQWEYLETQVRLHSAELEAFAETQHSDPLEASLQLNPTLALAHFQWPVHRIGPDFRPDQAEPVWLAVWRQRDDKVSFIRLNDLSARLLTLISEADDGRPRTALARIAAETGQPIEVVLKAGARLVASLGEREILL